MRESILVKSSVNNCERLLTMTAELDPSVVVAIMGLLIAMPPALLVILRCCQHRRPKPRTRDDGSLLLILIYIFSCFSAYSFLLYLCLSEPANSKRLPTEENAISLSSRLPGNDFEHAIQAPAVRRVGRRLSIRDMSVKTDPIMPHMLRQVVLTWRQVEGDTAQISDHRRDMRE